MSSVGVTLAQMKLVVRDPRARGVLTSEGARFDCNFWDKADWALDGVEIIEDLGCALLQHYADPEDQEPDHWTFSHYPGEWPSVRPGPSDKLWIEQPHTGYDDSFPHVYASLNNRYGAWIPDPDLPDNPNTYHRYGGGVSWWIRTSEPMTSGWDVTTDAEPDILTGNYPHVYVQFAEDGFSDSLPKWMVLFPEGSAAGPPLLLHYARWHVTGVDEVEGLIDPFDGSLIEVVDAAGTISSGLPPRSSGDFAWRVVWEFADVQTQGADKSFSVRTIPGTGCVVFDWERWQGPQTCLFLPQWPAGEPYLRIGGRGLAWAWCLGKPKYQTTGTHTARSKRVWQLPLDVTTAYAARQVSDEPAGTSATVGLDIAGTNRTATLTLATTDEYATPVVWRVAYEHAPVFGSDVTTAVFDSANVAADNRALVASPWELGDTWRGGRLSFTVRDVASAYAFKPNQVVEFHARLQGDVSWTEAWTGRIARASWVPYIASVGRTWTIECADETMRLSHKRRGNLLGSLAGLPFHTAVKWLLECAGVPNDRVVCCIGSTWTAIASITTSQTPFLPWSRDCSGDLTFSASTNVPQVLDRLCELAGWEWGVNVGPGNAGGAMGWGDVCFWPKGGSRTWSLASDASCTFAWTSALATSDQHVMKPPQITQDPDAWGNVVEVQGSDGRGVPVTGYAARTQSLTDPTDAFFVGDVWTLAENCTEQQSPGRRAADILGDAHTGQTVVTWEGPAVTAIRPSAIVKIQIGATPDYVLAKLTRVRHEIAPNKRTWKTAYTGEVVPTVA